MLTCTVVFHYCTLLSVSRYRLGFHQQCLFCLMLDSRYQSPMSFHSHTWYTPVHLNWSRNKNYYGSSRMGNEWVILVTMFGESENPIATHPSASPSRVKSRNWSSSGFVLIPTKYSHTDCSHPLGKPCDIRYVDEFDYRERNWYMLHHMILSLSFATQHWVDYT